MTDHEAKDSPRPQDLTRGFSKALRAEIEEIRSQRRGSESSVTSQGSAGKRKEADSDWSDAEGGPAESHEEGEGDDEHGSKRRKSWRVTLSASLAREIYKRRPQIEQLNGKCLYSHGSMRNARHLAEEYHVSAKTIRDIWNRYSWAKATRKLWTEEETQHYKATYPVKAHHSLADISQLSNPTAWSPQPEQIPDQWLVGNNKDAAPPITQPNSTNSPSALQVLQSSTLPSFSAPMNSSSPSNASSNSLKQLLDEQKQKLILQYLIDATANSGSDGANCNQQLNLPGKQTGSHDTIQAILNPDIARVSASTPDSGPPSPNRCNFNMPARNGSPVGAGSPLGASLYMKGQPQFPVQSQLPAAPLPVPQPQAATFLQKQGNLGDGSPQNQSMLQAQIDMAQRKLQELLVLSQQRQPPVPTEGNFSYRPILQGSPLQGSPTNAPLAPSVMVSDFRPGMPAPFLM